MHAAFDNTEAWSPMYQRNNKRTGLKNIRCFPYCSESHIEKGFCGRPIILRVARSYRDPTPPVFAWGEFRRVDDPRDFDVDTVIDASMMKSRTKDPKGSKADTLLAPYFEGIVEGGDKYRSSQLVKFVFNQRKKGWNYAWQASKHTAKARHAFFAYLFVKEANDSFRCVGIYVSPTFILYCRKRKSEAHIRNGIMVPGGNGLDDDDDDDDDYNEYVVSMDAPTRKASKPAARSTTKRQASSEESHRKMLQLEPIVSPAKLQPMTALTSTSTPGNGNITPFTAMFLSSIIDDPFATGRSNVSATPSSFSGDDSDTLDFDAANQIDPTTTWRIATVLDRLHSALQADGTAEVLGLPQHALDWFINDLDLFSEELGNGMADQQNFAGLPATITPSTSQSFEPLDWSAASKTDIISELNNYLLEESSLSASIRQVIAQDQEGRFRDSSSARLRAFINIFQSELSTFLAKRGYTERDLDDALQGQTNNSSNRQDASNALSVLNDHVSKVVETQRRLSSAMNKVSWSRAVGVRPEVDISGHWRIDDSLLQAFDECRYRRGMPFMMRRLLSYMEGKIAITHTSERIVIWLETKLFASPEVSYETDNVERPWDVAPPIPWPRKLCETYRAWITDTTVQYCHTYNNEVRSLRVVKKNASGDRLEVDVFYQEFKQGEWITTFQRKGYAVRMAAVD